MVKYLKKKWEGLKKFFAATRLGKFLKPAWKMVKLIAGGVLKVFSAIAGSGISKKIFKFFSGDEDEDSDAATDQDPGPGTALNFRPLGDNVSRVGGKLVVQFDNPPKGMRLDEISTVNDDVPLDVISGPSMAY